VGRSNVLAGRQQVLDPAWDESAEGNLEGACIEVHVVVATARWMQIDGISTPDGVSAATQQVAQHILLC
jgi:hypothetical protein